MIYESLLDIDPDSGKLLPWLATSWHYRDALTLDLTIRSDRCFSDGAPLTPVAVAQSFSDIIALKHLSPRPAAITMLTGLDRIATGANSVTFHFTRHNAAFLRSLASVNLAISSESGLGTGRWRPGRRWRRPTRSHRLMFREGRHRRPVRGHRSTATTSPRLHNPGISYGLCPNASRADRWPIPGCGVR